MRGSVQSLCFWHGFWHPPALRASPLSSCVMYFRIHPRRALPCPLPLDFNYFQNGERTFNDFCWYLVHGLYITGFVTSIAQRTHVFLTYFGNRKCMVFYSRLVVKSSVGRVPSGFCFSRSHPDLIREWDPDLIRAYASAPGT